MVNLIAVLLSVAFHEIAHTLTAEWLGLRVKRVTFSFRSGLGVWREPGSPWRNALVAAAGPAMSFLLAWLLWPILPDVAYGNLGFAVFCTFWPSGNVDGPKALNYILGNKY